MATRDESERTPAERLQHVRDEIGGCVRNTGRAPGSVTLVAVSKTFEASAIEPVLAAGQRRFGENRVQEAARKWPALRERHPDVELHLVGGLQTNKAREAIAFFDVIQSVDRPKLARALAEEMARQGRRPTLLVQVNTGAEPQKSGVPRDRLEALVDLCRNTLALPVAGLMCIPPFDADPGPHFRLLATDADRLGLACLSMGMSGDYPAAIAAGATMVRVGTAIFGTRD